MPKLPYKTDVAVLISSSTAPTTCRRCSHKVRQARPLGCSSIGTGLAANDMAGINACREVVADIDWECEVHRMYKERNYGCDLSEYTFFAKWAFSIVDKCIVLEDDDVPSLSFFPLLQGRCSTVTNTTSALA